MAISTTAGALLADAGVNASTTSADSRQDVKHEKGGVCKARACTAVNHVDGEVINAGLAPRKEPRAATVASSSRTQAYDDGWIKVTTGTAPTGAGAEDAGRSQAVTSTSKIKSDGAVLLSLDHPSDDVPAWEGGEDSVRSGVRQEAMMLNEAVTVWACLIYLGASKMRKRPTTFSTDGPAVAIIAWDGARALVAAPSIGIATPLGAATSPTADADW